MGFEFKLVFACCFLFFVCLLIRVAVLVNFFQEPLFRCQIANLKYLALISTITPKKIYACRFHHSCFPPPNLFLRLSPSSRCATFTTARLFGLLAFWLDLYVLFLKTLFKNYSWECTAIICRFAIIFIFGGLLGTMAKRGIADPEAVVRVLSDFFIKCRGYPISNADVASAYITCIWYSMQLTLPLLSMNRPSIRWVHGWRLHQCEDQGYPAQGCLEDLRQDPHSPKP